MPKSSNKLSIQAQLTILKPVEDVFAAVVNPIPYFAAEISQPMAENTTVQLRFPEMPIQVPLKILKLIPNERIDFEWDSGLGGNNRCEFRFSSPKDHNRAALFSGPASTVSVTEFGWPGNDQGREFSYRNQMGWTHMLCSLKAWLEYGVNLRTGSFLHMKF